jgi:DNA-binding response OmpR family regulator
MTGGGKRTVLLVEDHRELAETVAAWLEASGYAVDFAADGLTAMHLAVTESYSVIVLDVMLPGPDGLEVCRRLRRDAHITTPVIMLTARDQLSDKLAGFEVGADDYLVKPFDMPELEARIEAVLRRAEGLSTRLRVGDLTLDTDAMDVRRGDVEIQLSRILFEILKILMRESPNVVPRRKLEREVWGDDLPDSDTLRSHMYNLRRHVDKPFDLAYIHTRPGHGYCLRADS